MSDIAQICQELPPAAHIVIWAGFLLWEYLIGKTKFGSTIGLLVEKPINKAIHWLHLDHGP